MHRLRPTLPTQFYVNFDVLFYYVAINYNFKSFLSILLALAFPYISKQL
jgi:hypothetical protein